MRGQPRPTLFPYTTLFRSQSEKAKKKAPAPTEGAAALRSHFRSARLVAQPGRVRVVPPQKASKSQRSEEHTSELQSHSDLVCRLLLEKQKRTDRGGRRTRT